MRCLVTGSRSGIGRYLCEVLGAEPFTRQHRIEALQGREFDCIIHTAVNQCRGISSADLHNVIADNLLLTKELVALKPKCFVFFSSIDVYPSLADRQFEEEELLPVDGSLSLYGLTKLMGESIVRQGSERYLIIRPGLLLGSSMRPNSVSKVATGPDPVRLSLAASSEFYVVTYQEVQNFIAHCLKEKLDGCYNVLRALPVTLEEVAAIACRSPEYGTYVYRRPKISNTKALKILPQLASSSLQAVADFFALGMPEGSAQTLTHGSCPSTEW